MISRRKISNDTPFIIVNTLQQFDALDDPTNQKALKKGEKQKQNAYKQTIIIPKYQIIKQTPCKTNRHPIQTHYIKLPNLLNLPINMFYEPDEVDIFLASTIRKKFWSCFNQQILIECIQKLEQQTYQNRSVHEESQRRAKQQQNIILILQNNDSIPKNLTKIKQMSKQIHRYWLIKKQKSFNYPLIRKYWYGRPQLPFQPRNYEKQYQLRKKFTSPNDPNIIEYYLNDLNKVKQILELMLQRESKQKQLHERMLTQYTTKRQAIINRMHYCLAERRVNKKMKNKTNKSKSYSKYKCKKIEESQLSDTKEEVRQSESDVIKIQRLLTNLFFTTYPRDQLNLRIIKWASSGYLPFGKSNDTSGVSSGDTIRKKFSSWKKNK